MLAAPSNNNGNINHEQNENKQVYDGFESVFYTPSLFGTSNTFPYLNGHHLHSSSPDSFFSVMADLESSGTRTPSPRNDHCYDTTPFLYNHQRKVESTSQFNPTHTFYPSDAVSSFGVHANDFQPNLSNDVTRQPMDTTVQQLVQQIHSIKKEAEKKNALYTDIQHALSIKEAECREKDEKLILATQYVDAQAKKLNAIQTESIIFQSFIKSKGLELPITPGSENSFVVDNTNDFYNYYGNKRWNTDERYFPSAETEKTSTSLDYNRLLDKNVIVNWDLLVDRIIIETDQKASLYLQNKFKCATADEKQLIFVLVMKHAYKLMTNRFGNFLVQRLLELGTKEQILSLVSVMKDKVLELAFNSFGCHVVQKAMDNVDEHTKADLVSELFVSIPESFTHKYACHVWQKTFEIKWEHISPPPIMEKVHTALKGKWAQIALDETGSLVIQNIFENLTEEDKRPVLDEVLENTVTVARGQWGNWVIQHILEHAEKSEDRETAFQIVVEEGAQLSMDQFASKVVEKALRIGGEQFMSKFIKRISRNTSSHRPRVALIDIASDQYGNYVVQWLINNASEEHKIYICRLIKRHMVSLRSSKYGQRVAFLVERVLRNNEVTTYPSQPSF